MLSVQCRNAYDPLYASSDWNPEVKRRTFLIALAVLVSTGVAAFSDSQAEAASKPGVVRVVVDCEDSLKTPCVTFDEGRWVKVTSYKPYRSVRLSKCSLTRASKLPCVFTTKVKGGFVVGTKR